MNTNKIIAACSGIFLACLMLASQAAYAAVAGHAQFVIGSVQILNAAGKTSALQKGGAVNEGDTVISAKDASAQIRMQDGGFVAIRPDTRLKFDSFVFSGKEDGSENLLFTLIKGGFRSITGLIGRSNKPNYRIATVTATIGIRGTDHETIVVIPGSPLASIAPTGTYNKVNVGETYMATDKGTIFVLPNQMGFAGARDQMPQLQPLNSNLFTVASKPATQGMGDKKGDVRDTAAVDPNQHVPAVVGNTFPTINTLITPVCATDPVTGQCVDLVGGGLPTTSGVSPGVYTGLYGISSPYPFPPSATYTFDATGLILMDCGNGCFGGIGTAQNVDVGSDSGVITWGRWSNGIITAGGTANGINFGPDQGLHYIVGIPTPNNQMPTNITATYNLIGGTSPTPSDGIGGGLGLGHLISGSATVNFSNFNVDGNLVMGFNGASIYKATYSGGIDVGLYLYGTTHYQSGAINVCGTYGCSTQYQGQFYGTNASHMGIGYAITTQNFDINGVAALRR